MAETDKWEYTVRIVGSTWSGAKEDELLEELNRLGEAGWEVFSVENQYSSSKVRIVAKRRVPSPVRRSRQGWP